MKLVTISVCVCLVFRTL